MLVFGTTKWRIPVYCNLVETVASAGATGEGTTIVFAE